MEPQEEVSRDAARYQWLKEYATGYQLDILANLNEDEWDAYIDGAMARSG